MSYKTIKHHGDFIGKRIDEYGYYERPMLEYIQKHIKPDGLFIDIGANIGNHSVFFSKEMKALTLAIEPDRDNYRLLEINAHDSLIHPYHAALSNVTGSCELKVADRSNMGNIKVNKMSSENNLDTPMITLDDLVYQDKKSFAHVEAKHRGITLIKIDVEDHELFVIDGGLHTIREHKPHLFIETGDQNIILDKLPKGYKIIQKFNATPTWYFKYGS